MKSTVRTVKKVSLLIYYDTNTQLIVTSGPQTKVFLLFNLAIVEFRSLYANAWNRKGFHCLKHSTVYLYCNFFLLLFLFILWLKVAIHTRIE